MGYSQAQKAESRKRVLATAARQIRERGLEALGVADCMQAAGLTHGAFYAHFASREALITEALELAMEEGRTRIAAVTQQASAEAATPLTAIVDAYLSQHHVDNPGKGCTLCALAGDARHAGPEVQALFANSVQQLAARLTQAAASQDPALGLGAVATIVGAITLARAVDDRALAHNILLAARTWLLSQDGAAHPATSPHDSKIA